MTNRFALLRSCSFVESIHLELYEPTEHCPKHLLGRYKLDKTVALICLGLYSRRWLIVLRWFELHICHSRFALGLVFYDKSPRAVGLACALEIAATLPPFVSLVGLFVNASPQYIESVLSVLRLDVLQFHGEETPAQCARYNQPYIKVARVTPHLDLLQYAVEYVGARALLVDAYVEGVHGGTGQSFDWSLVPQKRPLPIILSGGLTPNNVVAAMQAVKPWAVDVSSGVESSPGIKDPVLIREFIRGVRNEDLRHA